MPLDLEWQPALSPAQLATLGTLILFVCYLYCLSIPVSTGPDKARTKRKTHQLFRNISRACAMRCVWNWSMVNFLAATVLIVTRKKKSEH